MSKPNRAPGVPDILDAAALRRLSWAFGVTQIVSWGSLFYAVSVLGNAIRADLGISREMLFAVVSLALMLNGLGSPLVGRRIDARGGRRVMVTGSVLAALAFVLLAFAQGPISYALGWTVGGIAMPMVLYDPAFATVTRHSGGAYRRSLATITMFGGLAGTLFWPLTSLLLDRLGWRGAFGVFAALQLCVCLPLHWRLIPVDAPVPPPAAGEKPAPVVAPPAWRDATPALRRAFVWLTIGFALMAFNMAALLVHLLFLLQARGLSLEQAVLIGSVIGPSQVVARSSDVLMGGRIAPLTLGMSAMGFIVAGVAVLAVSGSSLIAGFVFAVLFGIGNGLQTISRGLIVAEVFGRESYGLWLGRMSRWVFGVHAIAPFVLATLVGAGLGYANAAWVLLAVTSAGLLSYRVAVRNRNAEEAA